MEILHVIGICPDSLSHIDIFDLIVSNYQTTIDIFNLLKHYGK
jgi:hypothetical protein